MIVGHCLSNVHINHLGNLVRLQILIQKGWGGGDGLVAQLSPTLCDSMDCSLPGSSFHGIFQTRILEWAAILFSRGSSPPRDRACVSCILGGFFTN